MKNSGKQICQKPRPTKTNITGHADSKELYRFFNKREKGTKNLEEIRNPYTKGNY